MVSSSQQFSILDQLQEAVNNADAEGLSRRPNQVKEIPPNAIQAVCSNRESCPYFENHLLSGDEEPLSCMSVSTNVQKDADALSILDTIELNLMYVILTT